MKRILAVAFIVAMTVGLVACSDDDAGDMMGAALDYDDAFGDWVCGCYWEEEFSSEQECLDYATWSSDERSERIQCSRDAMAEVDDEKPEGVDEYFACSADAYGSGASCIRDIDQCGPAGEEDLIDCEDDTWDTVEDCIEDLRDDEDTEAWVVEWENYMSDLCPNI